MASLFKIRRERYFLLNNFFAVERFLSAPVQSSHFVSPLSLQSEPPKYQAAKALPYSCMTESKHPLLYLIDDLKSDLGMFSRSQFLALRLILWIEFFLLLKDRASELLSNSFPLPNHWDYTISSAHTKIKKRWNPKVGLLLCPVASHRHLLQRSFKDSCFVGDLKARSLQHLIRRADRFSHSHPSSGSSLTKIWMWMRERALQADTMWTIRWEETERHGTCPGLQEISRAFKKR